MFDSLSNLGRWLTGGEQRLQAHPLVDPLVIAMTARAQRVEAGHGRDLVPIGTLAAQQGLVRITPQELAQHAVLLGKTGTGKSSFLVSLIAQILRTQTDQVLVVFDPHGVLDGPVLRLSAAAGRRVVQLDLSGRGPLVTPWSPLGQLTGLTIDERASVAHRALSSAFAPGQGGGFVDATLRTVLYLLAAAPDSYTLAQAEAVLLEPGRAERILASVASPNASIVSYVRQLRALGPRASYTQTRYAFSRLDSLLATPGARATFCGRGTFDLVDFLRRPGGVLVITAPRAVLAESAVPTLAWLLELLVHALLRRSLPCHDPPVTIVVDEVFAIGEKIPTLASMLAELRKFRASLYGSMQSLTQCTDRRLVDELVNNTGLKALFGLSPQDASRFVDLLALPAPRRPRYEVGTRYVIKGHEAKIVEPGPVRERADVDAFERALRDCPPRTFHLGMAIDGKPVTARVEALELPVIPNVQPQLLHARPLAEVQRELAALNTLILTGGTAAGPPPATGGPAAGPRATPTPTADAQPDQPGDGTGRGTAGRTRL